MRNGKVMLFLLLLCLTFLGIKVFALAECVKANAMETETKMETETIPLDIGTYEYKDTYYILCNVTETNEETFIAQLPNGEYHEFYMINDCPTDDNGNPYFGIVVFKVLKQGYDNYDAWIVIDVM